jgi:hypothetical protein
MSKAGARHSTKNGSKRLGLHLALIYAFIQIL